MGKDPRTAISQQIQRELEQRTRKALKKRHYEFRVAHGKDTQAQLLDYVRACAAELGHSPAYGEIVGYAFLTERFGSWCQLLRQAGLPPARRVQPDAKGLQLYKEEYKRQNQLHKAERSSRIGERMAQQRAQQAAQQPYVLEDSAWGKAHKADTDEQLLAYLRARLLNFDAPPEVDDILGGHYLANRLGGWKKAIRRTGVRWDEQAVSGQESEAIDTSE